MNIQRKKRRNCYNTDCRLVEEVGAGVHISPVAFLVIQADNIKLLPVTHSSAIDKLLDYVPDLFDKVNDMMGNTEIKTTKVKEVPNKREEKNTIKKKQNRRNQRTKEAYEFEYTTKKPEAYLDEEPEEELDD